MKTSSRARIKGALALVPMILALSDLGAHSSYAYDPYDGACPSPYYAPYYGYPYYGYPSCGYFNGGFWWSGHRDFDHHRHFHDGGFGHSHFGHGDSPHGGGGIHEGHGHR